MHHQQRAARVSPTEYQHGAYLIIPMTAQLICSIITYCCVVIISAATHIVLRVRVARARFMSKSVASRLPTSLCCSRCTLSHHSQVITAGRARWHRAAAVECTASLSRDGGNSHSDTQAGACAGSVSPLCDRLSTAASLHQASTRGPYFARK